MMEDLDLGLKRPANLLFTVVEQELMVMGDLDIGLRPDNIPPITHKIMLDWFVYLFLLDVSKKLFMEMEEVIVLMIMEDVYLGLNRPDTLPFTTMDKVLMVMVEVDIGLRTDPITTIIQVSLVDHLVYLFMVTREVDIGLRPYNFIYITMVDYTLSTQGLIKKILQGVCK